MTDHTPKIEEGAYVSPEAKVTGSVFVGPHARIEGSAAVNGRNASFAAVRLRGKSRITGGSYIDANNVVLWDNAVVEDSVVMGDLQMDHSAALRGGVRSMGAHNHISGCAVVSGDVGLLGNVSIYDDAQVTNESSAHIELAGVTFRGRASIKNRNHFVALDLPMGRITLQRNCFGGHQVNAGCQSFSLDERPSFYQELARDHGWELPEYWDLLVAAMRRHVDKHF